MRNKYEKKQLQENNDDSKPAKQSKQDSKKSHSRKAGYSMVSFHSMK